MNKRGFTIVELLSVVVITAVLVSVLTPVFAQAKLNSKRTAVAGSLKGFWQGLMIYQNDNDHRVEYGSPEEMGLPPVKDGWMNFVKRYTGDDNPGWGTKMKFLPCGLEKEGEMRGLGIVYMPSVLNKWKPDVTKLQQNTVVMVDKNCNMPGTRILCQFCEKRSIGVTLSGQIKDRVSSSRQIWDQSFYR